jgi:hypothetical protein
MRARSPPVDFHFYGDENCLAFDVFTHYLSGPASPSTRHPLLHQLHQNAVQCSPAMPKGGR